MILLTKNLINAADAMAAAHEAEAARHRDPQDWKKRLHHAERGERARSFAADMVAIETDLKKGTRP